MVSLGHSNGSKLAQERRGKQRGRFVVPCVLDRIGSTLLYINVMPVTLGVWAPTRDAPRFTL